MNSCILSNKKEARFLRKQVQRNQRETDREKSAASEASGNDKHIRV